MIEKVLLFFLASYRNFVRTDVKIIAFNAILMYKL